MNTRNYDQGFIYQSLYTEILTEKVFKYKNSVPQKMVKALYGKKAWMTKIWRNLK